MNDFSSGCPPISRMGSSASNPTLPRRQVDHLLLFLDAAPDYKNYSYTKYALHFMKNSGVPSARLCPGVCSEIARHFRVDEAAAKRSVRTFARVIWHKNRPRLEAIAGRPLSTQPDEQEFLLLLASWLESSD